MLRRLTSLILVLAIVLTILPVPARAEETPGGEIPVQETETAPAEGDSALGEAPAPTMPEEEPETTEETAASEATEPAGEDTVLPDEPAAEPEETQAPSEPEPGTEEESPTEPSEIPTEPSEPEEAPTEETLPMDAYLGTAPEQTGMSFQSVSPQTEATGEVFVSGGVSGDLNSPQPTKAQIQQMYYQVTYPTSIFAEAPSVRSPYAAGRLSDSMLQSGITTLNYVRCAANLPSVALSDAMNADSQHGAVVNAANDVLSHTPSCPPGMDGEFYDWGYYATSHSNLAYNYGYPAKAALQLSVLMFMDDDDAGNNDRVGHRRWLLNPYMKNIGFGYAQAASGSNYVAAEVFGCYSGENIKRYDVDYEYIAWPAAGNFPTNLFGKAVPWSVTLNPSIYATPSESQVTVTLTRESDGKVWRLNSASGSHSSPSGSFLVVDTGGYGDIGNCIIFHPQSSSVGTYDGIYTVDITGLYTVDGTPAQLHYQVDFFDVDTYVAPPAPIAEGSCGEALNWAVYSNGELKVSGEGAMDDFDAAPWNDYTGQISRITLENGITTIGSNAFAGCSGLTEMSVPDSVSVIGSGAFRGCSGLNSLMLPPALTALGDAVFAGSGIQQLQFTGSLPELISGESSEGSLAGLTALAFYPGDDSSWSEEALQKNYGGSLTWIPAYDSRYVYEITASRRELLAGEKASLEALLAPGSDASGEILWTLAEGDEVYAKLTGSGAGAVLTANAATEPYTVTVTAAMEQEGLPAASVTVNIRPKAQLVRIFEQEKEISGETILFDLNRETAPGVTQTQLQLTAGILPEEAPQNISWKSANTGIATVEDSGLVTFTGTEGAVKITASATDGSKKTASVTLRAVRLTQCIRIEGKSSLIGGNSQTMTAINLQTEELMKNTKVSWYLAEEDAPYASVSTKGKLTTRKVTEKTVITVFCAVSGNENAVAEFPVTLHPQTALITICEKTKQEEPQPVVGPTVFFDLNEDSELVLSAALYPVDVMELPVVWTVSDAKKQAYAGYCVDEETNAITIHSPTGKTGTVTIKAVAQDGSKKAASVKVQFGRFAKTLQILNTEETLKSGSSLQLEAAVSPENVTRTGVSWRLKNSADKNFVTLSAKGKLTAKTVYGEKTVTVTAASKDGMVSDDFTITILPKNSGILVLHDEAGSNVTRTTVPVDLNKNDRITLTAHDFSDGQQRAADWKSSKTAIAVVDNGVVTFKKPGSVTITATAEDGRKATVSLKATKLASAVTITSNNNFEVASGKSITLKASLVEASGSKVTWSISSGAQWAKISSSGRLTAEKNLAEAKAVVVRATAADGSGKYAEKTVTVRPLSTGVQIYSTDEATGAMLLSVDSDDASTGPFGIVRSNTTFVWDMEANPSLRLSAKVYPCSDTDAAGQAIQAVTWKSSGTKVATIDAEGTVTCKKAGSTTITATAADGSGKKVSFKLTVVKRMTSVELPDGSFIAGGKSLTLKPEIGPSDTTNKKLTWKITGGSGAAYATISQKGVLKTGKVTAPKTVEITVTAQDGSACTDTCTVTVYPATTKVMIWSNGANVTGQTITAAAGTEISLSAACTPISAAKKYTWKSSNTKYATVDEYGNVLLGEAGGKTVTITAAAADGSGQKAIVKIKITAR